MVAALPWPITLFVWSESSVKDFARSCAVELFVPRSRLDEAVPGGALEEVVPVFVLVLAVVVVVDPVVPLSPSSWFSGFSVSSFSLLIDVVVDVVEVVLLSSLAKADDSGAAQSPRQNKTDVTLRNTCILSIIVGWALR